MNTWCDEKVLEALINLDPKLESLLFQVMMYAKATDVPIVNCLAEAISDWIHCTAFARLEVISKAETAPKIFLVKT